MKKSLEWTEADILKLIESETPESLTLDYKRSESLGKDSKKRNEISKDVSAFANSAGGILIYGVAENKNLPLSIDEGVDPTVITKEWLEQVINSNIQRRISGIRINQIKLSSHPTNVIYVVDVPQSDLAPHMAYDKKFYKRFNFESIAMEEYEVRDVSNRNRTPNLDIDIFITNKEPLPDNFRSDFILTNKSMFPAEYTYIDVYIDTRLKQTVFGVFKETDQEFCLDMEDQEVTFKRSYKQLSIPDAMPILYGVKFSISNDGVRFLYPPEKGLYYIIARVTTAGVEPKRFIFTLTYDGEEMDIVKGEQHKEV
ncbi:helix-turn-helix domain-containing protein [Priestia aryabhattai]|uniref:AlbA family DNA-binding domain-containing protein n=1 Tax=Priestia aryabhattai TaxID=412384 RepID=UPI00398EC48C